jgi:hypothetical protein
MALIPLSMIAAGTVSFLLVLLLLLGDATAPGRMPPAIAAMLALGGAGLIMGGLARLETRKRDMAGQRS